MTKDKYYIRVGKSNTYRLFQKQVNFNYIKVINIKG